MFTAPLAQAAQPGSMVTWLENQGCHSEFRISLDSHLKIPRIYTKFKECDKRTQNNYRYIFKILSLHIKSYLTMINSILRKSPDFNGPSFCSVHIPISWDKSQGVTCHGWSFPCNFAACWGATFDFLYSEVCTEHV